MSARISLHAAHPVTYQNLGSPNVTDLSELIKSACKKGSKVRVFTASAQTASDWKATLKKQRPDLLHLSVPSEKAGVLLFADNQTDLVLVAGQALIDTLCYYSVSETISGPRILIFADYVTPSNNEETMASEELIVRCLAVIPVVITFPAKGPRDAVARAIQKFYSTLLSGTSVREAFWASHSELPEVFPAKLHEQETGISNSICLF